MEMAKFRQADMKEDLPHVRELFSKYLQWVIGRANQEFGTDFDPETILEEDMEQLDIYSPPDGCLVLASEGHEVAGIGCLKKVRQSIGEIRRMYVRPEFRGRGLGRDILDALLSAAQDIGYSKVRLDSPRFVKEAHSLYRSAEFQEIEPYPESQIPPEFREHWIYMEKTLVP
jgi:GNAT superfamily N-acetyltransferase